MSPSDGQVGPPLVGAAVVRAVLRRPDLWVIAARVGLRLAEPGWWHRWPPRPSPSTAYARFRAETMYGRAAPPLGADDAVGYLEWCRRQPRHRG